MKVLIALRSLWLPRYDTKGLHVNGNSVKVRGFCDHSNFAGKAKCQIYDNGSFFFLFFPPAFLFRIYAHNLLA